VGARGHAASGRLYRGCPWHRPGPQGARAAPPPASCLELFRRRGAALRQAAAALRLVLSQLRYASVVRNSIRGTSLLTYRQPFGAPSALVLLTYPSGEGGVENGTPARKSAGCDCGCDCALRVRLRVRLRVQAQVELRSSSGRAQVELRSSSGRAQVELRSSSERAQVELRSSSGRAQVELRSSSGRAQGPLVGETCKIATSSKIDLIKM
jgi:hypothetical protein